MPPLKLPGDPGGGAGCTWLACVGGGCTYGCPAGSGGAGRGGVGASASAAKRHRAVLNLYQDAVPEVHAGPVRVC